MRYLLIMCLTMFLLACGSGSTGGTYRVSGSPSIGVHTQGNKTVIVDTSSKP